LRFFCRHGASPDLFRFYVACFVLWKNIDFQIGQTQCSRLGAGCALEPVVDNDNCRMSGLGKEDPVAHGGYLAEGVSAVIWRKRLLKKPI
jgi:hypothetical protein